MGKFISRVKNLRQKAAELKAAMEQAPATIAEIRETVAATTGQLHQLKNEVQSSVTDLKVENADRISHALQEINSNRDVFHQAGFDLGGVDLELSPVQRLIVHLHKLEDVHPSDFRSLLAANQQKKTIHALLKALVQAQQMADKVELVHLDYSELIVGLGPIPSVRICWRAEEVFEAEEVAGSAPAAPVPTPAPASPSFFGRSSYFERRPAQPAPAFGPAEAEPVRAGSEPAVTREEAPQELSSSDWRREAFERLKTKPHESKYRR